MNTPAHLIFGLATFGKPNAPRVSQGALLGGLLPDLSLCVLAGGALVLGYPPNQVFGTFYYSEAWQTIFAIDNSVFLWGLILALGLWLSRPALAALGAAAMLHVALDFPLHHDDGRPHFWPLSDWVYASPVSYWDPAHHGGAVSLVETGLALALTVWLWRQYQGHFARAGIVALALAQLSVGGVWAVVFG